VRPSFSQKDHEHATYPGEPPTTIQLNTHFRFEVPLAPKA